MSLIFVNDVFLNCKTNELLKKAVFQHLKPWEKLLIYTCIIMLGMFLSAIVNNLAVNILGADISQMDFKDYSRMDVLRLSKIFLFISHICLFVLPALAFVKLVSFEPREFLRLVKPKKKWLILLPLLFICLTLINQLLLRLNHMADFSFVSEQFQADLEFQQGMSQKRIGAFVGGTWKSLFYNLILIAIVPAIGEELTFRGVLQHLFIKGARNMHIGIIISAALFTLIHFQPFNVLPLFGLGLCYGYIACLMGSIWYTIILHFLNNALFIFIQHFKIMYPENNWDDLSVWFTLTLLVIGIIGLVYLVVNKNLKTSWHESKGVYLR